MATHPTFRATGFVNLDVYRKSQGSYIEGEWVPGEEETLVLKCNIQPLKFSDLMSLPESDRTREWLKVYSDSQLRHAQEGMGGFDADEFIWQGYRYRVMRVKNYAMGVLDHWQALAARIPVTPG